MSRELDAEAREILDGMEAAGLPPKRALHPPTARELLDELLADRGDPVTLAGVRDLTVPGPDCPVPVRLYRPEAAAPLPVFVYYHGGAWVRGSLESHDPLCRRLAARIPCLLLAVDYRLAPEHPFPAGLHDAYAAAEWAATNAESLHGDPDHLVVGGDSAGGNLAAAVSLLARDHGGPAIAHQALLYPTLNYHDELDSYEQNEGYFNTRAGREWAWEQYLGDDVHARNPYAVPMEATDLGGLPSATVLTCEFDMLRDEGQAYASRLAEAGVAVTELFYEDLFHAVLNFPELDRADDAYDDIAASVREALD